MVQNKLCPRCKRVLPLEEFTFDKRTKTGRTSFCKKCNSKMHKEWYAKPQNKKWNYDRSQKWKQEHPIVEWASDIIQSHKASGYKIKFSARALSDFATNNQSCWLCGGAVIFGAGRGNPLSATIDRIFNEEILTLANINLAHFACNAGKSNSSLQEFVQRCKDTVTLHQNAA